MINTPKETAVYKPKTFGGKTQIDISSLEEDEIISSKQLKSNSILWRIFELITSLKVIYVIVKETVNFYFHR